MPLATAWAANAASVEGRCDSGERSGSGFLDALDDRQDVRGEPVGFDDLSFPPERGGFAGIGAVAQPGTPSLAGGERGPRSFTDQASLFLSQGGIEVEHERVGIGPKLGDDEWNTLRHQAGDEGDIAREPIELGDDDWAPGGSAAASAAAN